MEIINCVIGLPLGIIALLFVFIGWRRGIRFRLHDYQGNKRERLRDNFFSSFAIITGICCVFPIFSPASSWGFFIPFSLLSILVLTPLAMLGESVSSFLFRFPTHSTFNVGLWGSSNADGSVLQWYEYTPFALVMGWAAFYLVYIGFSLVSGTTIMSDAVPVWIILVGFTFGIVTSVLLTLGMRRKFESHPR